MIIVRLGVCIDDFFEITLGKLKGFGCIFINIFLSILFIRYLSVDIKMYANTIIHKLVYSPLLST